MFLLSSSWCRRFVLVSLVVSVVYIKNIDLSFSEVLGPHGFIRVIFKKFLLGLLVSTAYLGNPLIANKFISDCFMCLLITLNTKSAPLRKIKYCDYIKFFPSSNPSYFNLFGINL